MEMLTRAILIRNSTTLSDDEVSWQRQRRQQKRRLDDWAAGVIQKLVKKRCDEIEPEFQSDSPDFPKLEGWFQEANKRIQNSNIANGVPVESNLIPVTKYQNEFDTWSTLINSDMVKDNPEKGWKAYDALYSTLSLVNREYDLPSEWNISPDVPKKLFGDRPESVKNPSETDTDSAVDFSDESESESEESSDEVDGIDALESRMRKEYSALSRGKVLYWWPVGTGTGLCPIRFKKYPDLSSSRRFVRTLRSKNDRNGPQ